jgi:hypothetical protein
MEDLKKNKVKNWKKKKAKDRRRRLRIEKLGETWL